MKLRLPFGGLIDAYGNIGDASPPFFISIYSNYVEPFNEATYPDVNWRRAPRSNNDIIGTSNKEQEASLFLKIKPIRENIFHESGNADMEGIFIEKTILATRFIDGPPAYVEQDWGLTVAVSECDIKHRPWEDITIILEMKTNEYPDTESFYNYTLELDSTNFAITPAFTYNPPTGYFASLKRFYKTTGVIGTDTSQSPATFTNIYLIESVTPSSSNEPPTPA